MDSSFAVQMYIQSQIRKNPEDFDAIVAMPLDQDPAVWQYEHLRQVCLQLNQLVVLLAPECTPQTCNEMKAGEWQYLCAAHQSPQTCAAMDYIVHTLDGATALLNSNKYFPSRSKFDEFENETHLYARFQLFSTKYFKLIPNNLITIEGDGFSGGGGAGGAGGQEGDDGDDGTNVGKSRTIFKGVVSQ
ncbi:hypothetical protein HDU76_011306 [Blyttiomyces sp. JEL0837]|nr:hypothetical protein HDU76_011306 [Blyttiomyces sp. JEL0837]